MAKRQTGNKGKNMKICPKCKTSKEDTEFNKNKSNKSGLSSHCKVCIQESRATNKEAISAQQKSYREANRGRESQRKRAWYEANKEHTVTYYREYRKRRPEVNREYVNRVRAQKKQGCIEWDDKELNELIIKEIYAHCQYINELTGVKHEVDHILPMNGKQVSGLHHYSNLRVITADENRRKSNLYIPQQV